MKHTNKNECFRIKVKDLRNQIYGMAYILKNKKRQNRLIIDIY